MDVAATEFYADGSYRFEGASKSAEDMIGYYAKLVADYPIVSATEVPTFELVDSQTPTSYNPLGAKGIGEAGTIGSTPAVHNAVVDAVSHLGVRHVDMPTTPMRVWRAIREAQQGGQV